MSFEDRARFQVPPGLVAILTDLYISEINVSVTAASFFDAGWRWTIRVGDEMNGFKAERVFDDGEYQREAVAWLLATIKEHYPSSDFVRRLPEDA